MNLKEFAEKIRQEKRQVVAHCESNKLVLNAENFFLEDNEKGIIGKQEFYKYLTQVIKGNELQNLEKFFGYLNDKCKVQVSSNLWVNPRNSHNYYFVDLSSKVSRKFPIRYFEGIDKLIDGYGQGVFICQLNLDDLLSKAYPIDEEK